MGGKRFIVQDRYYAFDSLENELCKKQKAKNLQFFNILAICF